MSDKIQLEIPYSRDTRLSGRLIALAFFLVLFFGICIVQNISFGNLYGILIAFFFSIVVGLSVFVSQNGQTLEITMDGISINPDELLFFKKKVFYKKEELEKIKLCAIDSVEYARGYVEIVTKNGHKIELAPLLPSQAKYLSEIISNAFGVPLDVSDFTQLNW